MGQNTPFLSTIEAINKICKKQSKERGELNKKRNPIIEGLFSGMKKKEMCSDSGHILKRVPLTLDTI